MKLFVGLGNPGSKYENTRHNIGFKILDIVCERNGFSEFEFVKKYNAYVSEGNIGTQKIIAIKPQTFMNLSGESISKIVSFYKIEPKDILVFQDDIDIDSSKIRLKFGGKNGGHNGIRDIENKIGTSDFWRLKIGVGRSQFPGQDVSDYVLSNFTSQEYEGILSKLDEIFVKVAEYFQKSA